jgi:hypothetical protein
MSKGEVYQRLDSASEISLSVKGRKSGRDISRPVWFVHEGNNLYLLPNHGSDTNWYKNFLANQLTGKPIAESGRVRYVMSKFNSKYGAVRKYYPKPDVAVEVSF